MTTVWPELDRFLEHMEYWIRVQQALIDADPRKRPNLPRFSRPYMDGNRLVLPDDPRLTQRLSDAWFTFSITHDEDLYVLRTTGESRGVRYVDRVKVCFSTFPLAAKFVLARHQADLTRDSMSLPVGLPLINWQWINHGPAPGWGKRPIDRVFPGSTANTTFFRLDHPDEFFLSSSYNESATFPLSMELGELTRIFAEGIPGIDHIPMPD